jgi:hypothetical protein
VVDPSLLLWNDNGTSTYAGVSETLLTTNPGAWLVESAGSSLLFRGEPVPGGTPVPALTPTYFTDAWTYGDTVDAPGPCTAAVMDLSSSTDPTPLACPPGALLQVGPAPCEQAADDGGTQDSPLSCGGISDDLALALSGLAPAATWLTRARSIIAPGTLGVDSPLVPTDSSPTGPVVTCTSYDDPCGVDNGGTPPPPVQGSPGGSSTGGSPGSGSGGNAVGAVGDVVQAVADSSSDGCDGDTSESSGDSCGGDASDDDAGDDCSSSPSGDDCTLGVTASVRRGHRRHGPTSRLLLLLAAWVAVVRRRGRRVLPAA